MYSPPHAADSDSEGSLLSDVSASPPRRRSPPRPAPPPPPPPPPKHRPRPASSTKPKLKPTPPAASARAPAPPPPPTLRAAALSDLHGLAARIAAGSALTAACGTASSSSFRRLVQSRNPSFDPATAFTAPASSAPSEVPSAAPRPSPTAATTDAPPQARPKRVHPNSVSEVAAASAAAEQPKRARGGSEGNFVRLNINGYGRRRTFKNSQAKRSTKCRSWRRQRAAGATPRSQGDEEGNLVAEALLEREKKAASDSVLEAVESVREDPSEQNLTSLLNAAYGHDSFRQGQLEAIQQIVAGESTMLVLPTGAGKSLCYQVPAMILPGLTLVVSPLLSLMVDQLRKLPAFLPGGLLASSQTSDEFHDTLQRLRAGEIKVLFVSPERFLNEEFLLIFRDTLPISLVAIDEAHCISEWSHNFRPSYLRLRASLLRRKLNVQCILAMTATATTQTLEEIMNALEIPSDNLIQASQIRENLQLSISTSDNRLKDLMLLLKSPPFVDMRSIIVYCKFQAETNFVSKYLCDNNITAKSYHSGLLIKNRSRVQELFCSNKIRVVVATVAFGMGLDKSDVEGVIHYSLPESLEEYIQETGRAGRDGRDGVDGYAMSKFLYQIFSSENTTGCICSLVKELTSRKFDIKEEVLLTILTQLEIGDQQYIRLLPQFSVTCTLYFHKFSGEISFELKDPAYCYVILWRPDDFSALSANLTKWLSEVESSKIRKLDAMFTLANFAVKGCKRTGGCSGSQHTPCIQKKIMEYFSKDDGTSENDCRTQLQKSSPFLQADIKVFIQSNSFAKFTPRAVARIMHGISSPAFPSATWSKNHFWGRYVEVDFPLVMEAAKAELARKGGVAVSILLQRKLLLGLRVSAPATLSRRAG
uniref:DNA 3'-5' helicase n=1 Tax=Oryza meridionalis TaxID=40149 RepID=A0A0E0DFF0_9ORYZ